MKLKKLVFTVFIFSCSIVFSQELLQSGPMVGYSTMREALLWVQTKQEVKVYFEYYEKGNSKKRYKTTSYTTNAKSGF